MKKRNCAGARMPRTSVQPDPSRRRRCSSVKSDLVLTVDDRCALTRHFLASPPVAPVRAPTPRVLGISPGVRASLMDRRWNSQFELT
jgi:hypothetical protein